MKQLSTAMVFALTIIGVHSRPDLSSRRSPFSSGTVLPSRTDSSAFGFQGTSRTNSPGFNVQSRSRANSLGVGGQAPSQTDSPKIDNCTCTPFYKCFDNDTSSDVFGIVDDRVNMIGDQAVINIRPTSEAAVCPSVLEVRCCRTSSSQTPTTNPQQPSDKTFTRPNNGVCGWRNHNGVGVQVNGFKEGQAQYGEFPWTVALLTSNTGFGANAGATNLFVGGGSLIHPRVVLTAAHKPYDNNNGTAKTLTVRAGEWNFADRMEPTGHQDIRVIEVINHPRFNREKLIYNVALLVLERPVVLGDTVSTICLPQQDERFDGQQCILSGWGKDVFGDEGRYQRIMKEVNVNMVENSKCESELKSTRLGSSFTLHRSSVCAGDRGEDACTGDGGSPLVCPQNGRYIQVGISAWGIGCGTQGLPGVYSDVPTAIEFIQKTLDNINNGNMVNNEQGCEVGNCADIRGFAN